MRHSAAEYLVAFLFLLAVPLAYRAMLMLAASVRLIPWQGGGVPPIRYLILGVLVGVEARRMLGQSGWDYWILAGILMAACVGIVFALIEIAGMAASGLYTYGADDNDPDRWSVAEAPAAPRFFFGDGIEVQIGHYGATNVRSGAAVMALLIMFLLEIATSFGLVVFGYAISDFSGDGAMNTVLAIMGILLGLFVFYFMILALPMTRHNLWVHAPGGMVSLMNLMGWPVKMVEVSAPEKTLTQQGLPVE